MLHCDADTLALVALGEPLSDDERSHLRLCARCQAELDQNRAVVGTGRSVTADDIPVEPPAAVWSAISKELGLDKDVEPFVPSAEVVYLADRRRPARRATWLVAAAVAGIAVGALGAAWIGQEQTNGTVVAMSELATVPADAGGSELVNASMSGSARIVDTDGQDYAEVDARGLPVIDGYYEVWLIRSDLSGMISLGALSAGSRGRFVIPEGTDLTQYTILDVSVEPLNGDPGHSKKSVLRGTIDA